MKRKNMYCNPPSGKQSGSFSQIVNYLRALDDLYNIQWWAAKTIFREKEIPFFRNFP
jgi:hypothetical protein